MSVSHSSCAICGLDWPGLQGPPPHDCIPFVPIRDNAQSLARIAAALEKIAACQERAAAAAERAYGEVAQEALRYERFIIAPAPAPPSQTVLRETETP